MSEITVFDVTSWIKTTHPNLNTIKMNVVKSKECEKFKAQVNWPVLECTLNLHLFMDVKVMKNGFASRWVLSNLKKHINNHIFKVAQSSSTASTPSIASFFHRQAKKHKLDGAVDEQSQSDVSPDDFSYREKEVKEDVISEDLIQNADSIPNANVEEIDGVYEVENVQRDIFLQSQGQLGKGKVQSFNVYSIHSVFSWTA
jgi:hypothetical protein